MERPETYRIEKVARETPTVASLYFKAPAIASVANPGQFVMVWIPRLDEIPLSVSSVDGDMVSVTVKNVGEATAALHAKKEGDYLGLRGPYGNAFDLTYKRLLLVGGGVGIAPLAMIPRIHREYSAILAARTKAEIFWGDKFIVDFNVCTDDGTMGEKAYAHELVKKALEKGGHDCVLACGPEIMLKKCFEVAQEAGVEFQASLERYMKCGVGACGQCSMDPAGWRVCRDGPVIKGRELSGLKEFGSYKRDGSGAKCKL